MQIPRVPISPTGTVEYVTEITDAYGVPILVITSREMFLDDGNGKTHKLHYNALVQLCDGTTWHTGLLKGPNPKLPGVCEFCRRPPYRFPWRDRPRHGVAARVETLRSCRGLCQPHACFSVSASCRGRCKSDEVQ